MFFLLFLIFSCAKFTSYEFIEKAGGEAKVQTPVPKLAKLIVKKHQQLLLDTLLVTTVCEGREFLLEQLLIADRFIFLKHNWVEGIFRSGDDSLVNSMFNITKKFGYRNLWQMSTERNPLMDQWRPFCVNFCHLYKAKNLRRMAEMDISYHLRNNIEVKDMKRSISSQISRYDKAREEEKNHLKERIEKSRKSLDHMVQQQRSGYIRELTDNLLQTNNYSAIEKLCGSVFDIYPTPLSYSLMYLENIPFQANKIGVMVKLSRKGEWNLFFKLQDRGGDIDDTDEGGHTPLMIALQEGNWDVAKKLLPVARLDRTNKAGEHVIDFFIEGFKKHISEEYKVSECRITELNEKQQKDFIEKCIDIFYYLSKFNRVIYKTSDNFSRNFRNAIYNRGSYTSSTKLIEEKLGKSIALEKYYKYLFGYYRQYSSYSNYQEFLYAGNHLFDEFSDKCSMLKLYENKAMSYAINSYDDRDEESFVIDLSIEQVIAPICYEDRSFDHINIYEVFNDLLKHMDFSYLRELKEEIFFRCLELDDKKITSIFLKDNMMECIPICATNLWILKNFFKQRNGKQGCLEDYKKCFGRNFSDVALALHDRGALKNVVIPPTKYVSTDMESLKICCEKGWYDLCEEMLPNTIIGRGEGDTLLLAKDKYFNLKDIKILDYSEFAILKDLAGQIDISQHYPKLIRSFWRYKWFLEFRGYRPCHYYSDDDDYEQGLIDAKEGVGVILENLMIKNEEHRYYQYNLLDVIEAIEYFASKEDIIAALEKARLVDFRGYDQKVTRALCKVKDPTLRLAVANYIEKSKEFFEVDFVVEKESEKEFYIEDLDDDLVYEEEEVDNYTRDYNTFYKKRVFNYLNTIYIPANYRMSRDKRLFYKILHLYDLMHENLLFLLKDQLDGTKEAIENLRSAMEDKNMLFFYRGIKGTIDTIRYKLIF